MISAATASRQFATGLAAFFVTALLVLANAPSERPENGLRLHSAESSARVRAVLTTHG